MLLAVFLNSNKKNNIRVIFQFVLPKSTEKFTTGTTLTITRGNLDFKYLYYKHYLENSFIVHTYIINKRQFLFTLNPNHLKA